MSMEKDDIIDALKAGQLDLRAENRRLQERVKEAERRNKEMETNITQALNSEVEHRTDRDRYKALAERRKKALERIEDMTTDYVGTSQAAGDIAKVARAAIEEAP